MRFIGIVITTLVFVNIAIGGENFAITGDVGFRYEGDIYICLYNIEKYKEFYKQGHDLSQPECKYIKMNADLIKAKQVSFKFEGIPKGIYVIVTYQDENKNGRYQFRILSYCLPLYVEVK